MPEDTSPPTAPGVAPASGVGTDAGLAVVLDYWTVIEIKKSFLMRVPIMGNIETIGEGKSFKPMAT